MSIITDSLPSVESSRSLFGPSRIRQNIIGRTQEYKERARDIVDQQSNLESDKRKAQAEADAMRKKLERMNVELTKLKDKIETSDSIARIKKLRNTAVAHLKGSLRLGEPI